MAPISAALRDRVAEGARRQFLSIRMAGAVPVVLEDGAGVGAGGVNAIATALRPPGMAANRPSRSKRRV